MRYLVASALTLSVVMAGPTLAEPIALDDAQLDRVTAGAQGDFSFTAISLASIGANEFYTQPYEATIAALIAGQLPLDGAGGLLAQLAGLFGQGDAVAPALTGSPAPAAVTTTNARSAAPAPAPTSATFVLDDAAFTVFFPTVPEGSTTDIGGNITPLANGTTAGAYVQVYSEDRGLVVSPGVSSIAVGGG